MKLQRVHRVASELCPGRRLAESAKRAEAGSYRMVEARRSDVQPRGPAEASRPLGQTVAQGRTVRRREKIEHRPHPVLRLRPGFGRGNRLAPDEGLRQAHTLIGQKEK